MSRVERLGAEAANELGQRIGVYQWSLGSRATALAFGLASLGGGLGWVTWELGAYGSLSVGGSAVSGLAAGIGVLCIVYSFSSRTQPALELFELGLVSRLHRRDTIASYANVAAIQPVWRGHRLDLLAHSPALYLVVLKNGTVLRIHSIRRMREAMRQIASRSGALIDIGPGRSRPFKL